MSLKKLKEENPELNINFVDILSQYDITKTKKLTPFLVKMFKKDFIREVGDESIKTINANHINFSEIFVHNVKNSDNIFLHRMLKDIIVDYLGLQNMSNVHKIVDHLNNKRISNPDITSYSDWEDLSNQISLAELSLLNKKLSKDVEVIHQDDEWLIIKPLSFLSSITYGSNTKWCTAMRHEQEYFYRYTREGILIYALNKVDGKKFAFHSNYDGITVWDQVDRRIDSLQTTIPYDILIEIISKLDINKNKNNAAMFSQEELSNMEGYHSPKKAYVDEPEEPQMVTRGINDQEDEVEVEAF